MKGLISIGLLLALLTTSCHAQSEQSNLDSLKLTAQAVEQINSHENEAALQTLLEAVQLWPDNARAHFFIGFIGRQRAATDPASKQLAVEHFREALRISPYGEFGTAVRTWLAKLVGRPDPVLLVMDTTGLATEPAGGEVKGQAAHYLQPTGVIARRATGEACLGFGDLMSSMFIKQARLTMHADTQVGYPFRFMNQTALASAARKVAYSGPDGSEMRYGWVVALGPLQGLSVATEVGRQSILPANLYASLPLTLIDPIDGRIVLHRNLSNDMLICALGSRLINELTKHIPVLGELLAGDVRTILLVNSLASGIQHSVARTTGRFRERELRDEVDVPLPVAGQSRAAWLRALGSGTPADPAQPVVYRTPRQLLELPRIAIAPPLCADVLAEEPVGDLMLDIASDLVGTGRLGVIPPSEIAQSVGAERASGSRRPLLRCYETTAQSLQAQYLLLTFIDDFAVSVSDKNLIQCGVSVRIRGHWALSEPASGNPVAQGEFSSRQSCTQFGDGGDRALASLEACLSEARQGVLAELLPALQRGG